MRALALGGLVLATAGCGASRWMEDSAPTPPPGPDEAKVIFFRTPAFRGWMTPYPVWDDDILAGIAENGGYFEYRCPPGRRLFHLMQGGFDTRALDAELEGGRTYFVRVQPGAGLVPHPGATALERARRDELFGRCGCRALRSEARSDEDLRASREEARAKAELWRGARAAECRRLRREDGE